MTFYGYGKILDIDLTARKVEKKNLGAKFDLGLRDLGADLQGLEKSQICK